MKHSRLWPVVSAFVLMLFGAVSVEIAAKDHRAQVYEIEISQNADTDDAEQGEAWFASAPVDDLHAEARRWAQRGDYGKALEALRKLVSERPGNDAILAEYGHWLRRSGRYESARQVLEAALKRDPDGATLHLDLAQVFKKLGKPDAALAHFQRALELRPNNTPTRVAMGDFLRRQGRFEEAIEVLEPAMGQGSNEERARALGTISKAYFAVGKRDSALKAIEESVERAPASAHIWALVADSLLSSDDPADHRSAIEHALRAAALAPNSSAVRRALGRAYAGSHMPAEAVGAYREAVALDPDDADSRRLLIRAALDRDDYALARRQAQALLRLESERPESYFLAGLVESRAGAYGKARAYYLDAVSKSKVPYAEAWYNLGRLARRAGTSEEAISAYEKALKARPDYVAAWNNLGLVYLDAAEYASAEASFRKAIELDGSYVAAWTNLGDGYSKQERYLDAIRAYRGALSIDPERVASRLRLAVALRKAGRTPRAIEVYEALVEDEPRYVRAWYNLGVALALSKRFDEAENAYNTALALDPNHFRSLKNLGLLEARRGNWASAEPRLTEALERKPDDIEVRTRLAELMLENGDLQGCRHHARLVLKQSQADASLQGSLARCVGH